MPETNRGIRQTRGDGGPVKAIRFPAALWALVEAAAAASDSYSRAGASEVVRAAVAAFVGAETNAGRWYTIKSHDGAEIPATAKCNTRGSDGDPDDEGSGSMGRLAEERAELRRTKDHLQGELDRALERERVLNDKLATASSRSSPDLPDVSVLLAAEELRDVWARASRGHKATTPKSVRDAIAAMIGALDARPPAGPAALAGNAPLPVPSVRAPKRQRGEWVNAWTWRDEHGMCFVGSTIPKRAGRPPVTAPEPAPEPAQEQDPTSALIQDAIQNPGRQWTLGDSAKASAKRRRK